eukprot:TRINITY_DN8932_c0_g1_i1.p1 TRINITY_DN8932_c0_g1~~TRINITY_DN8932_c0_g1_i1.p1  ORF type:complete len:347 (-),score=33.74 TRINITY_DN8932_c0_g1_i1:466-1506(-)
MDKREWTRTRSMHREERTSADGPRPSVFITLGRERAERALPSTNSVGSLSTIIPRSITTHTSSSITTTSTTTLTTTAPLTTTTSTTTTTSSAHGYNGNLTPAIQLDSLQVSVSACNNTSPRSNISPRLGGSSGAHSPAWGTTRGSREHSPKRVQVEAGSAILSEEIPFESFPIHDAEGRDFWVCFFGTKKAVLWENFYKSFVIYVEQEQEQRALRARELDFDLNLKRRCLLALLSNLQSDGELDHYHNVAPHNEKDAIVTIEAFGQMLHWFGSVGARWEFLTKLSYLLSKSWFFGKLSSRASEHYLRMKNQERLSLDSVQASREVILFLSNNLNPPNQEVTYFTIE